jgi:AcrR family transcriptional regulator
MSEVSRVAPPRQDRSRASLERVMEAGLAVLIEEGWENFTVGAACERAGVSVGLLYRRFSNKDAFMVALQDRWITSLEVEQERALPRDVDWSALTLEETVRVAIDGVIATPRSQETFIRALGDHGVFDEAGIKRLGEAVQRYGAWFIAAVLTHRTAIAHDDPEFAADFCFLIVIDAAIRRSSLGDEFDTGYPMGDWDAFAHELWSAACAYLMRPQR